MVLIVTSPCMPRLVVQYTTNIINWWKKVWLCIGTEYRTNIHVVLHIDVWCLIALIIFLQFPYAYQKAGWGCAGYFTWMKNPSVCAQTRSPDPAWSEFRNAPPPPFSLPIENQIPELQTPSHNNDSCGTIATQRDNYSDTWWPVTRPSSARLSFIVGSSLVCRLFISQAALSSKGYFLAVRHWDALLTPFLTPFLPPLLPPFLPPFLSPLLRGLYFQFGYRRLCSASTRTASSLQGCFSSADMAFHWAPRIWAKSIQS